MRRSKINTIVRIGMISAMAAALSQLKIIKLRRGSVNFSALPIIISSLKYGINTGIKTGIVAGVIRLILEPRIYHFLSVPFDYIFAHMSHGFSGIKKEKTRMNVLIGVTFGYLIRFIFHFISGFFIYFKTLNNIKMAFYCSALNNFLYLLPNFLANTIVVIFLYDIYKN